MGDGGHVDGQNIQILAANQVKQQVKRPLERFQKDAQRLRGI